MEIGKSESEGKLTYNESVGKETIEEVRSYAERQEREKKGKMGVIDNKNVGCNT